MRTIPFGQDKVIAIHGLQLHYVEWGETGNPPLVLLHGFQSHAHTWDTFSSAVMDAYHVLALDQRGHGDSAWPPDGDYTPAAFIRDIVGFLSALHLEPACLVGHSMGGRHATMVAAEHPTLVRKLVIVDTPAERPPHLQAMAAQQPATDDVPEPETFATFEEVIAHGMAQYPLTPEAELRHANYHNLYRANDGRWHWRWDPRLVLRQRLNRHLRTDLYTYLQRVQCPALLVRGQKSPLLTPEVAQKMLAAIPHARLVEVAHAAHTVNADNATAFEAATVAFLRA